MEAAESPSSRRVDHWVFAWCALMQRSRRWQTNLDEALQPHQLVAAEFLVLWRTGHATSPGITQVELARELNVSAAHVCGVVEKLQARRWLKTIRPLKDRRRLCCSLTSQGAAALDRLLVGLLPLANSCLHEDAPLSSPVSDTQQEEAA
jgi:DNA-binding MarR family transcriptional regulator